MGLTTVVHDPINDISPSLKTSTPLPPSDSTWGSPTTQIGGDRTIITPSFSEMIEGKEVVVYGAIGVAGFGLIGLLGLI